MNIRDISATSEADLIQGCILSRPHCWDEFIRRYGRLITSVASNVLDHRGAQGIEQEDFVSHLYELLLRDNAKRLRAWRGEAKFSTYLVQIARNACIDYLRSHIRHREGNDTELATVTENASKTIEEDCPHEEAARVERLREAMRSLSAQQALIIKMRLADLSLREIAQQLQVPQGTVFVQSSRALRKLRRIMAPYESKDAH